MSRAPIALALDTVELDVVADWCAAVAPSITTVKIGLELFLRHGKQAVEVARESGDLDLFLDLKLHDIPNTVRGAVASIADLNPKYLTVHALGGPSMIKAAAEEAPDIAITAVTILTSHSAEEVRQLGLTGSIPDQVGQLATMAASAGARAIVCSPQEVERLRQVLGPEITLITPGVRPEGSDVGDQKRVATPVEAMRAGASLLVIGRPITAAYAASGSEGVAAAAAKIASSLTAFHTTDRVS